MTKPRRIDFIDLSHFQANVAIHWPDAKKAGVKGVYHKATEGNSWTDPSYSRRRTEVAHAGLPFGAYHFARPIVGQAQVEAHHFLKVADPRAGDLVPVLDLETNGHLLSPAEQAAWVGEWFGTVFAATGVKRGLLYTQYDLPFVPKGVRLWVPRYSNDNSAPRVPKPFKRWVAWQFTDGKFGVPSVVPGVGRVDASERRSGIWWTSHKAFLIPSKAVKVPTTPPPVPPKPPVPPTPPTKETPVDRLVRIAKSQVGYHEGRSGGHWNNHQKFSPAVPGLEWSQNQAWCATFVSWCVMKADLAALFPRTASTDTGAAWFKSRKQWHEYPAVGAQVFFGFAGNMEHTGLVYAFDADFIYTIEGNTNTNGSAEGDGVYLKKRARKDAYVQGYGYPALPLRSADPNYHPRSN